MAELGAPHTTRVRLFRNGDQNFTGRMIVVNPRYYRNFETFLDTATMTTQCTSAVTRICTPQGRHTVNSVEKLANGGMYVAVGRDSFKKLKYGEPKAHRNARFPPIWRNQLPSSGRFRKVYEGEKQALKRIYVFKNGDNLTPARMILLKKRTLADMELVLAALQESRIDFDFAISKLFTIEGKQVISGDEIVHDGRYVALQRGSRFKLLNYEKTGSFSSRIVVPHMTRLPPLIPPQRNHAVKKRSSTKTNPKPQMIHSRQSNQKQEENQRRPQKAKKTLLLRDSFTNESGLNSQNEERESFSNVNLSLSPPPLDETPDLLIPNAQLARERGTRESSAELPKIGNIPRDIVELPEHEKESIGRHLYKASGMNREWGEMIVDNRNTVIEQLIDDIPADEIDEEIMETAEDVEQITMTSEENNEKDVTLRNEEDKVIEGVEVSDKGNVNDDNARNSDEEEVVEEEVEKEEGEKEEVGEIEEEKEEEEVEEIDEENEENEEEEVEKVEEEVEEVKEVKEVEKVEEEEVEEIKEEEKKEEEKKEEVEQTEIPKVNVENAETPNEKGQEILDDPKAVDQDASDENQSTKSDDSDDEAASSDGDDENDETVNEDAADQKDESPNLSRRSSQDMNSEDEVKSSEDEEEKEDDDDKDDDDDDDKSEENQESDEEEVGDKDEQQSVASEDEQDSSAENEENENKAAEVAKKENKTNQNAENQRTQPDGSIKKNSTHEKNTKNKSRIENKA